ncbi:MAG: PAS domain-containing protein [Planctomycetota bacterium]
MGKKADRKREEKTAKQSQLEEAFQQLQAANQQLQAAELQLRAANQQLKASEEESRALAKFPSEDPNPVLRIAKDCTVIFSNEPGLSLLGAWQSGVGQRLPKNWRKFVKDVFESGLHKSTEFEYNNQLFFLTFVPIVEEGYINIYGFNITKRRQAEEALAREHSLVRTLIDNLPDYIFAKDNESRFVINNSAHLRQCKAKSQEEVVGKTDFDFFPEKLASKYYADEKKVIRSGKPLVNIEEIAKDMNNKDQWLSTTKVPLKDSKGNVTGIVGIARDITARRETEKALKVAYQQLKAANQQLMASEQQLKAANQQLIAGEQQLKAANQQLIANEQQLKAANQQLTASEQQLKAMNQQLRATEKELLKSRELYRTMFENMLDAVAVYEAVDNGRDFIIRDINPSAERLEEIKKKDLVGKRVLKMLPRIKEQGIFEIFQRVWKSGKAEFRAESMYYDKGRIHWRKKYVFKMPTGEIVDSYEDITPRKQAEKELFKKQKQLQSLATQLSLTEERERKRIATELHDLIGQSLVFAKMKLDILQMSSKAPDFVSSLKEASDMLDQVIQRTDNLTFDLGSPILYELGLSVAIKDWLTEEIAKKYDIKTAFEDDGNPKPLDINVSAFIFRSVRELLVNVVKHAEAENVKVSLQREGDEMKVYVADDGIGFECSDSGISRDKRGGYGLFSIRERLDYIGGHLEVNSQPHHGTQVVLTVPLAENDLLEEDKE